MVWYSIVCYGIVCYGMLWYDIVCYGNINGLIKHSTDKTELQASAPKDQYKMLLQ